MVETTKSGVAVSRIQPFGDLTSPFDFATPVLYGSFLRFFITSYQSQVSGVFLTHKFGWVWHFEANFCNFHPANDPVP